MSYSSLDAFISGHRDVLSNGPVALIFAEDDTELVSTLNHHLDQGFRSVVALMPDSFELPTDLDGRVRRVSLDCSAADIVFDAINRMIAAAEPGTWFYYCYNAEYLFYPFCETRSVGELLAFHADERRNAMLTYVVDLYAEDLSQNPDAVSLEQVSFDRLGYYAMARYDPATGGTLDRQMDFYGGLRWRFEEHVNWDSRRIDRIALFRTKKGLELQSNHTFNDAEYNTVSCPWHHNLTATLCSFRAAKALKRNPGSAFAIDSFKWSKSTRFEWHSRQLLDLGLMEPGQWF
ncbi:glycosyltransferase family 2 protein [Sedimentitalea sp. XS_ASV28]|uniref:glycosyltransferase family 2 protein n=1 Tax=Sedimentitalea sp. XS_ASV28 TaxID=3241296 RepID=UPI00351308BE